MSTTYTTVHRNIRSLTCYATRKPLEDAFLFQKLEWTFSYFVFANFTNFLGNEKETSQLLRVICLCEMILYFWRMSRSFISEEWVNVTLPYAQAQWLTNLPESPNHYHSKGRITIIIFVCFCFFFRAHPWHMKVPKLGVELELHLLGYTTATATWDPSSICNLHFSSQQHWVFNPLIQDRDWTCILMDASPVHLRWATKGTPYFLFFLFLVIWQHMEFPGQGSDPSRSCDLSYTCSNAGSLTHCARPRIEPTS